MKITLALFVCIVFYASKTSNAQDSISVQARATYNEAGLLHRKLFGENYRKEWAEPTKVPIIQISTVHGGLKPIQRGGGQQTLSLRLEDKNGKEWVLRTIEKYPEIVLPEQLRTTFAKDWLDDSMSANHPYGALIVPVLAEATGVAHTNPVIGLAAPDKAFGEFAAVFENKLCLLEEREPIGKSDNTEEMFTEISEDNDNSVNAEAFLRATLLDVIIGDSDRHADQWRWKDEQEGSGKKYLVVPRDRDFVFYVNQGVFPHVASREWLLPFLQGFDYKVENITTFLGKTRLMANRFLNQLTYEEWMSITKEFVAALPDAKLEEALQQLPESAYRLRRTVLFNQLKSRRDNLEKEMDKFYRFINKILEIQLTDKNERVVMDENSGNLSVTIHKLSKNGKIENILFSKVVSPAFTKEVRLFIAKGNDSVLLNTGNSAIKVRIVGGEGKKVYVANDTRSNVIVYEKSNSATFIDPENKLAKHLSDDSLNTAIIPTNRYHIDKQFITGGYNNDDGVLLGLGYKHIHQGFRKVPYASVQQITAAHSLATKAFRINYSAEWLRLIGNADLLLKADILGPNNTMNFFGRGNETAYNKTGSRITFYRTRFNIFQLDPALRWKMQKGFTFSAGLSFQYYRLNPGDNAGRFITSGSLVNSYDSISITRRKLHAGLAFNLTQDKRNDQLLPSRGYYFQIKAQGYEGLNNYSRSFLQIMPDLRIFKSLTRNSSLVIAERFGGGITAGNTAFYQSLFLGGQDNLLGYRQFRFAGQHMVYNNLEFRLRAAKLATYILPGELGFTGFYDTGRIWEKNEKSDKWHHGAGVGAYFAPARFAVIQFIEGYSEEGWYPYLKLSMRF